MGACLKHKIQWEEVISWQNVAYFLLQRKKLEECHRVLTQQNNNQKTETSRKVTREKELPKSHYSKNPTTPTSSGTPRVLEVDEDSIKITVVDDINVYLLHLELEQTVCLRILLYVANR